jgi:tetratricopeptide (TPR) repeat protein
MTGRQGSAAMLASAFEHHQRGELEAAARIYKAIIHTDRDNADALHLYGVLNHQCGRHEAAIKSIRKAIKHRPSVAAFHSNLGEAYRSAGRTSAAENCYRRALAIDPGFVDALINYGVLQRHRGQTNAAIALFRQALSRAPGTPEAWFNLGGSHLDAADWPAAAAAFRKVVKLAPDMSDGYLGLAGALKELEDYDSAATALETAIERGVETGAVLNNLGNIHMLRGDFLRATACLERALEVSPDNDVVLCNWADTQIAKGELEAARRAYFDVLEQQPDNLKARTGLTNLAFFAGDWNAAWDGYDQRFKSGDFAGRAFPLPNWNGEALDGRRILVWGEQGVGEEIQFASMIPDLLAGGAEVVLESDPRLVPLFQRSWPAVECVARTDPPAPATLTPDLAYQVASGSLGRFFRQHEHDFANASPFLRADRDWANAMRRRYQADERPILVGVAWHSKKPTMGRLKSMDLREMAPLFRVRDDIRFVDLQYGDTASQRDQLADETGTRLLHDDDVNQFADLDTFAAQLTAMDLVITVSNTTAHLAGALGVETWVLLPAAPLNRWMLNRADSPWYSSVRLFRQATLGDWSSVVVAAAGDLAKYTPLAR